MCNLSLFPLPFKPNKPFSVLIKMTFMLCTDFIFETIRCEGTVKKMTEPEVPISSGGAVLGTNRRSKRIGKRKEDLKTGNFEIFVIL